MPLLESWDVEVIVTVNVYDRLTPNKVLSYTTIGRSLGTSARGLPAAVNPALDSAIDDGAVIADNFRRESRNP